MVKPAKLEEQETETGEKTMEKLTVLVDMSIMNDLYVIIGREGLKNVSEAVRLALQAYIDSYKEKRSDECIVIKPAPKQVDMVQSIVELGEFNSKEEIVEYALRKYVEDFRTKYLQESKDYQEVLNTEKKRKNELEVMV